VPGALRAVDRAGKPYNVPREAAQFLYLLPDLPEARPVQDGGALPCAEEADQRVPRIIARISVRVDLISPFVPL